MDNSQQGLLDELARLRGLGEAYYDHRGELRYFGAASRRAILSAMGAWVDDESAVREAVQSARTNGLHGKHRSAEIQTVCFEPDTLQTQKCWGLSVQLYTLRSARNWGIGDFADLEQLIDLTKALGCDVIGLNPLHALFAADPAHCSPYSPSSRLFLNPLYIAVDTIPEFAECDSVQTLYQQESLQSALLGLRATDAVMYEAVAAIKFSALRLLYEHFCKNHLRLGSARAKEFADFVETGGESLRLHAVFEALDARFRLESPALSGWRQWPQEFQDPHSVAVRDFAAAQRYDVEFHIYLQWLAGSQLQEVQAHARDSGMRIGLYGDLAVGANPGGSEVWSNRNLFVTAAAIGAPPDPLALSGQDWGIPPIDPHALCVQAFAPFDELLRANMRHAGALRIDHVMSLFRLWWVPRGFGATEGVYVHYPLEELVCRLADASQGSRCLIVGEDLGTVPDEVRYAMAKYRLFHYKVLLFEKQHDRFHMPHEYVREAVATASTHDLPPLKAWWQGDDLRLRDELKLYPSADTAALLHAERAADRLALLRALREQKLWHWAEGESLPDFSPALARAIHLYLGLSNAALVLVQLEDLIGMTDPVNVPGTHTEHANWQRKLALPAESIFGREDVAESLRALGQARRGLDPNA